jgi:hypothetical protein
LHKPFAAEQLIELLRQLLPARHNLRIVNG